MTRMTQEQVDAIMSNYRQRLKSSPGDTTEPDPGPESSLQKKANQWLDKWGYPYIHNFSRKKNRKGKILDHHIYLPKARHVVIEYKVTGNKMSDEQKETFQKIMFLGHEIYEVRSFRRFLEIMGKH